MSVLLNKKRADEFLERLDVDALISSGRENTTYLTGFNAVTHITDRMYNELPGSGENFSQAYGIYSRSGNSVLVLPLSLYLVARMDGLAAPEIYTYGKPPSLREPDSRFDTLEEKEFEKRLNTSNRNFETAATALSAAVKEFADDDVLAMDFSDMNRASEEQLKHDHQNLLCKNGTELFRFLRMVKSHEEIRRLTKACEINEEALGEVISSIKEGASEIDLRRVYAISVASRDGMFQLGHFMLPTGTKGGAIARATSSKITVGTFGWTDLMCSYMGYYSDIGETFVMGAPTEKLTKYYNALYKVVERAEDLVVPGLKPSELNREIGKVWDSCDMPRTPYGMGHGIGLEIYDYPRISAAKGEIIHNQSAVKDDLIRSSIDIPFEEGMVLALEAPYLVWGWGGVHLERNVIVEKNGCKSLVNQDRFLRIL